MILLISALVTVLGIYLRSIDGGFLFDDHAIGDMDFNRRRCYVAGRIPWEDLRNHTTPPMPIEPLLQEFSPSGRGRFRVALRSFLTEPRALTHLTYLWTWDAWTLAPEGWHYFNLLMHAQNTILVYVLAWNLRPSIAGITALLFAVHPHQVAAVSYISGRAGLLVTFFALAGALICNPLGGTHSLFSVTVACLAFILAERAKEDGLLWSFLFLAGYAALRFFFG